MVNLEADFLPFGARLGSAFIKLILDFNQLNYFVYDLLLLLFKFPLNNDDSSLVDEFKMMANHVVRRLHHDRTSIARYNLEIFKTLVSVGKQLPSSSSIIPYDAIYAMMSTTHCGLEQTRIET